MDSERVPAGLRRMSDENLVERVCAGGEHAFAVLVERHGQNLFNFGVGYCGTQIAERALGATVHKLAGCIAERERVISVRAWLYRTAREAAESFGESAERTGEPDAREAAREAAARFDGLPRNQRLQLVLRELAGLSEEEAAHVLDLPIRAAKEDIAAARLAVVGNVPERDEDCVPTRSSLAAGGAAASAAAVAAHLGQCEPCAGVALALQRLPSALGRAMPKVSEQVLDRAIEEAISAVGSLGGGGGDSAARAGDQAGRGGDQAGRGGDHAGRGGEHAGRGGEGAGRGGERAGRHGDGARRGGEGARSGGEGVRAVGGGAAGGKAGSSRRRRALALTAFILLVLVGGVLAASEVTDTPDSADRPAANLSLPPPAPEPAPAPPDRQRPTPTPPDEPEPEPAPRPEPGPPGPPGRVIETWRVTRVTSRSAYSTRTAEIVTVVRHCSNGGGGPGGGDAGTTGPLRDSDCPAASGGPSLPVAGTLPLTGLQLGLVVGVGLLLAGLGTGLRKLT